MTAFVFVLAAFVFVLAALVFVLAAFVLRTGGIRYSEACRRIAES